MDKIRVGAVSYRNAKPLVWGIAAPEMTDVMDLSYDYPARLVDRLSAGQIDIGLIPVAAISRIPGARIIGSYGIAADGKVGSVALFSKQPMEQVQEVVLDYQSRTSVELTKILLREHWNRSVRFIPSEGDEYMDGIEGARAGLIIGDRALLNTHRFPFVYDLAEAWKQLTGLPFVFAAWVATRELPSSFLDLFEKANEAGLMRLDQLSADWSLPGVDMLSYFRDRIHYRIDEEKREGLQLFLQKIGSV